ncbi:hypothetical protein ASPWEDRAFT_35231 [Aspergillus wentii DTO 134E9]|uniref:SRR1-like domain-containing protein n=1 Tax=Aspergillus wentii DTO 134E9 TaxID=1073089 RepID=A0A1L9S3A7_ASPWE|nr:uncharacterized protein ASPWEDRAFT_35231 [Aspergillus wentii DTO 134E9]KAI9929984.1 hypothetical protein MW887_011794 [Aspergillus wentii]OJJ41638.1 hypothetical protein ASPWEDRAFT_35231 [Aspergillus wentii DTO 134E9]
MPHSSARTKSKNKNTISKRLEVTSDDGWTHVTTTHKGKNARRQQRKPATEDSNANAQDEDKQRFLVPAEAPRNLNLENLTAQFETYREKWIGSATCRVLRETVQAALSASVDDDDDDKKAIEVKNIICIGLGSPSGFLRGGWVDRRSVSMYQLAALTTTIDLIDKEIPIYAQDPVFNTLDKSLLSSLGVSVLDHPAAFDLVSPHSFLYCPGAERSHLEQLLQHRPRLLFGGPLEDTESEVLNRFCAETESKRVPVFELLEHAFWEMRVYHG